LIENEAHIELIEKAGYAVKRESFSGLVSYSLARLFLK
jgi:hypothetical protein